MIDFKSLEQVEQAKLLMRGQGLSVQTSSIEPSQTSITFDEKGEGLVSFAEQDVGVARRTGRWPPRTSLLSEGSWVARSVPLAVGSNPARVNVFFISNF